MLDPAFIGPTGLALFSTDEMTLLLGSLGSVNPIFIVSLQYHAQKLRQRFFCPKPLRLVRKIQVIFF